ncbi:RagB/SusD family nutrient uptake outer membrane protein [soil metagenome]
MKNFIKRKLTYALIGASLLGPLSCSDDFLEAPVTGQLTEAQLMSRAGLEGLLIGAYAHLNGNEAMGRNSGNINWILGSIRGGDANKGSDAGDFNSITPVQVFNTLEPTNQHPNDVWRSWYEGVARTNVFLRTLEKSEEVSDEFKRLRTAEARTLRAHHYFQLKRAFNMVPWIDPQADYSGEVLAVEIPNNVDIWPNIEADLQFAVDNLPPTQDQIGRVNKWAAMAYLGKVYLYQHKYAEAKAMFDEVIANGVTSNGLKYGLVEYFPNVFRGEFENNQETVWGVKVAAGVGNVNTTNHDMNMLYPYNTGPSGPGECCGFFQPSFELANSYRTANGLPLLDGSYNVGDNQLKTDMNIKSDEPFTPDAGLVDPRLDHTIARRGIMFLDWQPHPGQAWIRDQRFGGPYTQKKLSYQQAERGTYQDGSSWTPGYHSIDTYIIRFGDVLLMAAEAEVELGNLEQARAYVNMIRQRAANSPLLEDGAPEANYVISLYETPWTDAETARRAVRFERKLELALEGHRFYDLVRWGIAAEVLNPLFRYEEQFLPINYQGAKFTPGTHDYLPIPQRQIDLQGSDVLQQNPGY